MIRHKLLPAVIAAALLTLGACGSTSGTPTAQDSSTSSSSETSAADTAVDSTDDTAGETAAGDTTAADTESGDSSTAVTVDGEMDAQSAAWFGTVCDGVSPMIEAVFGAMGAMMGSATGTGDDSAAAKQAQATLVDTFNKASGAMTDAAKKLSSLPPPSVEHGDEIAAEAAAGLAKAGPAMKQLADTLSKATVTSMDDLSAVMEQANQSMDSDLDGLSLDSFELSDAMQAEVAKIPSCAPLMSLGSAADAATDTPTS